MSQDKNQTPDWGEQEQTRQDETVRPTETARHPETEDWEKVRTGEEAQTRDGDSRGHIRSMDYEPYRAGGDDEPVYSGQRRRSSAPLIILIVILVIGMLFAAWQLGTIFLNYHRDRAAYNDLAGNAISALAEAETKDDDGEEAEEAEDEENDKPVVSQVPIQVDWAYLQSVNSDVVGWLYCPGTVINYPVVQTNNNDFYLKHGFDQQSNTSGTLFADKDSVAGIVQSNFIIYGHNMKDNSMFGSVAKYVDKSYYEENPVMYYLTPNGNYRVDLIGCHIVESTAENYPLYFSSITDYQNYLDRISPSFFWINKEAMSTDYQLMSLSTCSYTSGYSDPRLLVHGVMVPIE